MSEATGRRRVPTWAKVLLWAVGTVVVLTVAFVVLLLAQVSGGFDDLLSGSAPRETDDRVLEAADTARAEHEVVLAGVVTGPAASAVTADGLAQGDATYCEPGQHSWKVDDPFDLSCRLSTVALVEGGTLASFREDMQVLDAALVAAGWERGGTSMGRLLADYWDDRAQILAARPGAVYPSGMPEAGYTREGIRLSVGWAQPGADAIAAVWLADPVLTAADGTRVTAGDLPDLMDPDDYGVTLHLSSTYFEE